MIIKNYELEKNLKPIDNKSFLLLYGENEGQKKDIIKRVGLKKWLKKELYYLGVKGQEWVL